MRIQPKIGEYIKRTEWHKETGAVFEIITFGGYKRIKKKQKKRVGENIKNKPTKYYFLKCILSKDSVYDKEYIAGNAYTVRKHDLEFGWTFKKTTKGEIVAEAL